MSEKDVTTSPEVKEETETTVQTDEQNTDGETQTGEEASSEPTVGDLQEDEESKSKKPDTVPMSRLDKEISKRKDLEKQLEELQSAKEDDPEANADKDPDVRELKKDLDQIKQREKEARVNQTIAKHLDAALENAPEYKDVVNKDVIKQMALNPSNKDKTYSQLLEEAYGNALGGKRTIETTTPRGGAKDSKVDLDRARRDKEYRHEVLADPELRKQYNEGIENRIPL